MNLPDFLVDVPGDEICLKGSRIGLYHVIYYHREEGFNAEQLHDQFPDVSAEEFDKVLEFYRQNRVAIDAYVKDYQEELDRQRATTPRLFDWDEMRRRWEKMKSESV